MTGSAGDYKRAAEALAKLAAQGSVGQVADHLGQEGMTGSMMSANRCPVARYVTEKTGVSICVMGQKWDIFPLPTGASMRPLATPDVVSEFVTAFDNGAFPELAKN